MTCVKKVTGSMKLVDFFDLSSHYYGKGLVLPILVRHGPVLPTRARQYVAWGSSTLTRKEGRQRDLMPLVGALLELVLFLGPSNFVSRA
jgi:hypothetical protein